MRPDAAKGRNMIKCQIPQYTTQLVKVDLLGIFQGRTGLSDSTKPVVVRNARLVKEEPLEEEQCSPQYYL